MMSTKKACPLNDTWYYTFCSHYHEHELLENLHDCPSRLACQNFKHILDVRDKQLSMYMRFTQPNLSTQNPVATSNAKKPASTAKKVVGKKKLSAKAR
jgi:hypothetical protein